MKNDCYGCRVSSRYEENILQLIAVIVAQLCAEKKKVFGVHSSFPVCHLQPAEKRLAENLVILKCSRPATRAGKPLLDINPNFLVL